MPIGKRIIAKPKRQSRFGEKVGNERKRHPLPLRLRMRFIPREMGGAEGWRGPGWATIRRKVIEAAGGRSSVSGFSSAQGNGLQVDHIHPFRLGGRNRRTNLRVTDFHNNPSVDFMRGARERRPKRDEKY